MNTICSGTWPRSFRGLRPSGWRVLAGAGAWLLIAGCAQDVPDDGELRSGYPHQVLFRQETPAMLEACEERIDMVVSDHHVWMREYAVESFAQRYPDKPVLIHVGGDFISANAYLPRQWMSDRGLMRGTVRRKWIERRAGYGEVLREDFVPMPDFPGFWLYEAGIDTTKPVPPGPRVTLSVPDTERFRPRRATPNFMAASLERLTGSPNVPRTVVLCPRDHSGELDWSRAELGEVTATDAAAGTIAVRRYRAEKAAFPPMDAGTYVAAAVGIWDRIDTWGRRNLPEDHPLHYPVIPFMQPNFSPYAPVDPDTGLNAAQWFACHFIERKAKYFPHSDGYALDVCSSTFFSTPKIIERADFNNDGRVDRGYLDGASWWGLGMHDFVYYLREGVPGVYAGMGDALELTWDSTDTDDQRFFHLLNGGEFEHTMIHGMGWSIGQHRYSSNLDRLLLWGRLAQKPNITFVSNKHPDDAWHGGGDQRLEEEQRRRPSYALSYWRLDLASACMVTGLAHKDAIRAPSAAELLDYPGRAAEEDRYGANLALDYDEFHRGVEDVRRWLGAPLTPPRRYRGHLGPVLYAFDAESAFPRIEAEDRRWAAREPERSGMRTLRFEVEQTGPFTGDEERFHLFARLPIDNVRFEPMAEYALRFRLRGSSPYGAIADRYRPIPRAVILRLKSGGMLAPTSIKPDGYHKTGFGQEILAFPEERRVDVTLQAPAAGAGELQIDLSESPGTVELAGIELRKGCADVLYRVFENGVVVLNGSREEAVEVDLASVLPGLKLRRLDGMQDPAHNSGEPVRGTLRIPPEDAFFLERAMPAGAWRAKARGL
ncbi:hypothetical protein [Kiritimatiella glycovorans]|uniref:Uncharacterized protein n=1 Tax=Kiritimatiella glycovorans TaxID=1307763 RepID=A0A0G3EID5_9BACT|nr:hypothetical protein [Kiritimatiella glycovorans]AKJ64575.1 hypothetical protein L21SP4_01327 [Kiritimatiella glycovorans]